MPDGIQTMNQLGIEDCLEKKELVMAGTLSLSFVVVCHLIEGPLHNSNTIGHATHPLWVNPICPALLIICQDAS